jgi:hypothetical protein
MFLVAKCIWKLLEDLMKRYYYSHKLETIDRFCLKVLSHMPVDMSLCTHHIAQWVRKLPSHLILCPERSTATIAWSSLFQDMFIFEWDEKQNLRIDVSVVGSGRQNG